MSAISSGANGQLRQLLRIKEARRDAAQRVLEAAAEEERHRLRIYRNAEDYYAVCAATADSYFRRRFEMHEGGTEFGHFFESVSIGNRNAQKAEYRAGVMRNKAGQRHAKAQEARSEAAQEFLAKTRSVEALETLIRGEQHRNTTLGDIAEEDELNEIHPVRRPDATR